MTTTAFDDQFAPDPSEGFGPFPQFDGDPRPITTFTRLNPLHQFGSKGSDWKGFKASEVIHSGEDV